MGRTELILGGLLTVLTASTSPWWWTKLFPETPSAVARGVPAPHSSPSLDPASPGVPSSEPPVVQPPPEPPQLQPEGFPGCDGKWFLQMAAGEDREGLRGVTDRIRNAGGPFAQAGLYTSDSGKYKVVVGCFDRVSADRLSDEFINRQLLANKPLVTQRQSLLAKVY